MEEKKPEMKETIEIIEQNSNGKKQQKYNSGSINIEPGKKSKKNQYKEWKNSTYDRERSSITTNLVDSAIHQFGAQLTNARHLIRHAINAGRKHGHVDKEKTSKTNSGM